MTERIKVYEEKKNGTPLWAWLLPLLLLLALLGYFLLRPHQPVTPIQATGPVAPAAASLPKLGTVHFDTDQATLTSQAQGTLDRAAEAMKNDPKVHLRIEGFTDNVGTDTHNLTLSQRRAIAVGTYLQDKGIPTARLTGQGFGEAAPADTNATDAGKADNRRVELYSE